MRPYGNLACHLSRKNIYATGTPEPSLSFLYELDEIPDDVYKGALVIVCDTANQARIDDQRYLMGDKLMKIDHHPNEDPYGDLLWVDTEASSVSEMIYELYLEGKEEGYQLNTKAAELIYAGIVGDTGRFLFPNTTKKTLKYAGELIEYPFSSSDLFNQLYETDLNVVKLNGYIFQHISLSENGVASVFIKREILESFQTTAQQASQLVGTLGNIAGIKAWVFLWKKTIRFVSDSALKVSSLTPLRKNIMAAATRLQPVRPFLIGP